MIRKDLADIEECDLRALCDTGREEDERIEFKQSFTGGSDLVSMSDSQRDRAVDGLAKELTALLNGKGGDLIIGIQESGGVADELTPVEGASEAAERLRRSLVTRIEPTPRAMRIRSVLAESSTNGAGYIVIRSDSSNQAPHRVAKSGQFYIRRGTEALPMNIIEIQDLTLATRTRVANIQDRLRSELFTISKMRANNRVFHGGGFQVRVVYVPLQQAQIALEGDTLCALGKSEPTFYNGGTECRNDVAFRGLAVDWRPVLRGKLLEHWVESDSPDRAGYASKRIHVDGTIVFDWFNRYVPEGNLNSVALHFEWYQGFLAEICHNLVALRAGNPDLDPGILGLAIRSELHGGNLPFLIRGGSMFQQEYVLPAIERLHELPYFSIHENHDMRAFFVQAQEDLLAIAGTAGEIASLAP